MSQIAKKKFSCAMLLGGLSVNLNHLKIENEICFKNMKVKSSPDFKKKSHDKLKWCKDYNMNKSTFQSHHQGKLGGVSVKLLHICRICWMKSKEKKFHRFGAGDCPFHKKEWLNSMATVTHDMVHASNVIYESKMPNYLGLQIPVMQFWNLDVFENLLLHYPDKEIIQFLKFGWPINHDGRQYSNGICKNWKGANLHTYQVNKYLKIALWRAEVV